MIDLFNSQKEEIKAQIATARNHWDENNPLSIPQLVRGEKEYEARMREFYSYFWNNYLPVWRNTLTKQNDLDEKTLLEALQEYAREDWIKNGFSGEIFDTRLKKEKLKKYPRNFFKHLFAIATLFIVAFIVNLVRFNWEFFAFLALVGLLPYFIWKAFTVHKE